MPDLIERLRAVVTDRYRVERELGRGGMAVVFLAEDLKHRRQVAIKVLDPEISALLGVERFRQEIEFAAQLQHPHILTLLDSGAGGGLFYYVMPFVEGESLRARLDRDRQLPVDEAVRLATDVARALDYAHRRGVVHRDVKPENILLADGQAVVTDFGIARAIRAAGGDRLTHTGVALGTPVYMSPEQVSGGVEPDARSDVYSLACVLYEMLAGTPPFGGAVESIPYQHLNVVARPVTELRPTVPATLQLAIGRALAKLPADRFASAAQFADALADARAGGTSEPAVSTAESSVRLRRGAVVAAIAALVIVAVFLLAWGWIGARHKTTAVARQWVWLAAFDGPADDPSLSAATRDLVGAAIDQSNAVATVPAEQVRIALRNAGRPDTARVAGALARELAYRSSIRVVVEGSIARIGAAYSLVLRGIDSEDGHVMQSANGSAPDDRALVPAVDRLARALCKGLGERPTAAHGELPLVDVATPSFEAFKLYTRGRALVNDLEAPAALPLLRRAVTLDPAFAMAWSGLGTAYTNMLQADSSRAAFREALRHPDRLTEVRRLSIEASVARAEGRMNDAIDRYEALLRLNPSPSEAAVALNNEGNVFAQQGRYQAALDLYGRAMALWPVQPPQVEYLNKADMLAAMARYDEADSSVVRLRGIPGRMFALENQLGRRHWTTAESLAVGLEADGNVPVFAQWLLLNGHASVLAVRGSLSDADALLARAGSAVAAAHDTSSIAFFWYQRAWLAALAGHASPELPAGAFWLGALGPFQAALRGDSARARVLLERGARARPPEVRAAAEEQVQAIVDWRAGRWSRVIERMRPNALNGFRRGVDPAELMRLANRWMVADAFDRLGQADSAVAYLGLILEPPGRPNTTIFSRGFYEPFVRRRLVELLLKRSDLAEARRQQTILAATCTRPDPDLLANLNETRSALRTAEAMSGGAKK